MRRSRGVWVPFAMLFGLEGILAGQAMMEHALGAGRAATSLAPAQGMKNAAAGVVVMLDKMKKTGQESSGSGSPVASSVIEPAQTGAGKQATVNAPPPAPAKIYEDPRGIQAGMANDELIRRFGPPTIEVTGASGGRILTYSGKNAMIQLELRNQKVVLVP
ncbi:MAG TPA: hypothetical protein VGZ73_21830 [Bryobacteraceae bacterium]|nr:hypothetical protein [Bryobacteraceae bacterium]